MEKNTIIAVVLCSLVLIVSFTLQGFFTQRNQPVQRQQTQAQQIQSQPTTEQIEQAMQSTSSADEQSFAADETDETLTDIASSVTAPSGQTESSAQESSTSYAVYASQEQNTFEVDNGVMIIKFTKVGGDVISCKLKNHKDKDDNVDMIFSRNPNSRAFSLSLDKGVLSNLFEVNPEGYGDPKSPQTVEFVSNVNGLKLTKRYEFMPDEYLFKLTVRMDGGRNSQNFNFAGNGTYAYVLSFGPQIGPVFDKLDLYDYRKNQVFTNGKLKERKNEHITDTGIIEWISISGKYFTLIAKPMNTPYSFNFYEESEQESSVSKTSRLNINRLAQNGVPVIEDTYFFYLGPKTQDTLSIYSNVNDNGFNQRFESFREAASSKGILAPLENILKWLLLAFYSVVRNYGIAIILLTLLIKILFFPLTKKGSEGTLRMQALAPKIKEIQDKYKGNPQKLQAEMANFYKQEGYNPLSGCLPLLLQIPIFIAMYGLFNTHFDLRGASFIPGWIPDLSVPEYIVRSDSFKFPILGWDALRGLPFIYVASQLLYGKITQMPGQQSNSQMKFMLYVMPLIFFFILYNVPSGLLIYWIFSNLLTLVQQIIINKFFLEKKRAANALAAQKAEQELKIAPGKKKKKNF